MSSRTVWSGKRRKLVLAFDIGTTFSGISYSILDPGHTPIIKGVTSGASKIPTIIYYDKAGKVRAVGAEATREGIFEEAEDGEWVKAEWFKLHLRSKVGEGKNITQHIPPLPPRKSIVDVFSDFLQYMLHCASSYIKESDTNGQALWNSVKDDIHFVLSHPNGWEGSEQNLMRQAVVQAKLVPDNDNGHARISFVTEGEASLHYAIQNGVLSSAINKGDGVVIVDAGGGTIDISSYRNGVNGKENVYEEIAPPQCYFHGSVFVSVNARLFLMKNLSKSTFIDDLDDIVRCFDKTTKPRFRNIDDAQYIKFGSTRDNDPHCNIRFGQLKLEGSDVAKFFQPSVTCVIQAVLQQKRSSHHKISHVVMVGGFSASDWLFNNAFDFLSKHKLSVLRPENHINKAVSDGAISFYLDHFVRTRVSKVTYGSFCAIDYDKSDPDHRRRADKRIYFDSGDVMIDNYFATILPKNTPVSEDKEYRYAFSQESKYKSDFKDISSILWCYRGDLEKPQWRDIDSSNYMQLCTIIVDLSRVDLLKQSAGKRGGFYQVYYDLVLRFGLTEMKAQVAWDENGVERRSPAKIVYDPDL